MILVREIFQVKFGRMKEAKELWKEGLKLAPSTEGKPRLLTDLTGQYYTLVLETTHKDLAAFETSMKQEMAQPGMGGWYQKFIPLVDSGRREIFTIV
jgi:hypothetical protein